MNLISHRMRRRLLAVVGVVLAGILVASCGSTGSADTSKGAGRATGAKATVVPVPGRTTVAYFFATGCVSCLPAARQVAAVAKAAPGEDAAYVAVNVAPGDTVSNLRGFLRDAGATHMRLIVDGASLVTRYKVTAMSTTIVFDPRGHETYRGVDAGTKTIATAVAKAGGKGTAG